MKQKRKKKKKKKEKKRKKEKRNKKTEKNKGLTQAKVKMRDINNFAVPLTQVFSN